MVLNGVGVNVLVVDAGLGNAIVSHVPPGDLIIGRNNVTVNVTDFAGRNSELSWFFILDFNGPFLLEIIEPSVNKSRERRLPFKIQAGQVWDRIEYKNYNDRRPRWRRLCRNCDEYGFRRVRKKTLNEGWNNISVRASNNSGISVEKNITVFIDSRLPRFSRTVPRRNAVINGSFFQVKYTEDNVESVHLFFNPNVSLANCPSGRNRLCSTAADVSSFTGRFITYFFVIFDPLGFAQSRSTKVFVDTSTPNITLFLPINNSVVGRRVRFNISVSERVKIEYFDSFARRPRWKRLCSRCSEFGFTRKKIKGFRKGPHDLIIRATDPAGNAQSTHVKFVVD